MDHMLNQRRVSMEQEFERRCTETIEVCHMDFLSKTDAALVRYKQVLRLMAPRKRAAGVKLMCSRQSLCVVNDQPVGNPKRKV
jgi:hypothetical protein